MDQMNVISVVKYKIKDGFEDDFVEALNSYDYSKAVLAKAISLGDNEYVSISEYESIDAICEDEITGLEWLDNVTHMLEYLSLEHKEFNKSWGVVDGLINSLQGFLEVFEKPSKGLQKAF